jgi:hypothetical protein
VHRLHPGDVEWWDFRSWSGGGDRVPVVVGAFPEPFLHGFAGKRRPAVVVGAGLGAKAVARRLRAGLLRSVVEAPRDSNVFVLAGPAPTRFYAEEGAAPGDRVVLTFSGDWQALLRGSFRFRYEVGR